MHEQRYGRPWNGVVHMELIRAGTLFRTNAPEKLLGKVIILQVTKLREWEV